MKFRWTIVTVPFAIWCCAVFLRGVTPACSFEEMASSVGASNISRYRELMILGVIGVVVILLIKLWEQE